MTIIPFPRRKMKRGFMNVMYSHPFKQYFVNENNLEIMKKKVHSSMKWKRDVILFLYLRVTLLFFT